MSSILPRFATPALAPPKLLVCEGRHGALQSSLKVIMLIIFAIFSGVALSTSGENDRETQETSWEKRMKNGKHSFPQKCLIFSKFEILLDRFLGRGTCLACLRQNNTKPKASHSSVPSFLCPAAAPCRPLLQASRVQGLLQKHDERSNTDLIQSIFSSMFFVQEPFGGHVWSSYSPTDPSILSVLATCDFVDRCLAFAAPGII